MLCNIYIYIVRIFNKNHQRVNNHTSFSPLYKKGVNNHTRSFYGLNSSKVSQSLTFFLLIIVYINDSSGTYGWYQNQRCNNSRRYNPPSVRTTHLEYISMGTFLLLLLLLLLLLKLKTATWMPSLFMVLCWLKYEFCP